MVNNNGIIQAQSVQEREGKIVLLAGMAAGSTEVSGTLDASAPLADGSNGGFIETSGAQVKVAEAARISTRAASGKAGLWLIDPTHFTIAASGGDMTGATLGRLLDDNDIRIQTTGVGSATGEDGNIYVNDGLRWSSGKTLTLDAYNNIYLNSLIDASQDGGGRLVLKFGQGNANGYVTNQDGSVSTTPADYYLGANGRVNLRAGANFATKLGGEAQLEYTVITQLGAPGDETRADATNSLQGLGYTGRLGGNYVLGADIDASDSANWNDDGSGNKLGFKQIGSNVNVQRFSGRFHGLGHVISGLRINRPQESEVGLFGYVTPTGELRDIGLNRVSIQGYHGVGALVGVNYGLIRHSYAEGEVTASNRVGGLAGWNSGEIDDSFAAVAVRSSLSDGSDNGGNASAGGLVGENTGGFIIRSYASGEVVAIMSAVGGLVGNSADGKIFDSYASGAVRSQAAGAYIGAGGLVGRVDGTTIINSYASGAVVATVAAGGLVGRETEAGKTRSVITDSYWKQGSAAAWAGVTTRATPPATALTAGQFTQQASFTGFDFADTWVLNPGQAAPQLRGVPVYRDPFAPITPSTPSTPVTARPTPPSTPDVLRSITERRLVPERAQGLMQLALRCAQRDDEQEDDAAANCSNGEAGGAGDGLLRVVGSGIRLPERSATMLSDQDFE